MGIWALGLYTFEVARTAVLKLHCLVLWCLTGRVHVIHYAALTAEKQLFFNQPSHLIIKRTLGLTLWQQLSKRMYMQGMLRYEPVRVHGDV